MNARIREFTSADYELLAGLRNAIYPDWPESAQDLRHRDETREAKCKWRRFFCEEDGTVVASGAYSQTAWMYHPRKFFVSVGVLPEFRRRGIGRALYDHVMASLVPLSPILVRGSVNEAHGDGIRFAEKLGFKAGLREQESLLDLTRFDPGRFAAELGRIEEAGIVIRDFAELSSDPEFRQKVYELDMTVSPDMPSPDPITALSFEAYCKELFENHRFFAEGYMVALAGSQYVGMSNLWRTERPERLDTGLTGVRREFRKKGVATALKLRALARAKEHGFSGVMTWNDSTNERMLNINWRLGFEKRPCWVDYERILEPATEDTK